MSSYISIGFVYDEDTGKRFKSVIDTFNSFVNRMYSGVIYVNTTMICKNTVKEYLHIKRRPQELKNGNPFIELISKSNFSITLDSKSNVYGFQIELDLEVIDLIYGKEKYNILSRTVIDFIRKFSTISNFEYAFCDHEAEILYTFDKVHRQKKSVYSILYLNEKHLDRKLILSDWEIDGHNSRTDFGIDKSD